METLSAHLIGYQIGCYINNNPDKLVDYIGEYCLSRTEKSFFNITPEHLVLFHRQIKNIVKSNVFLKISKEIDIVKNEKLNHVISYEYLSSGLAKIKTEVTILTPNLLYYYYKVDKKPVVKFYQDYITLVENLHSLLKNSIYSFDLNAYRNLNFESNLNFFEKTISNLKEHNDYFQIEDFSHKDLDKLFTIYTEEDVDVTMSLGTNTLNLNYTNGTTKSTTLDKKDENEKQ